MHMTCIGIQADIVVMPIKLGIFVSNTHKIERTEPLDNLHPEPLNGLVNTVARFEISRLNKEQYMFNHGFHGVH